MKAHFHTVFFLSLLGACSPISRTNSKKAPSIPEKIQGSKTGNGEEPKGTQPGEASQAPDPNSAGEALSPIPLAASSKIKVLSLNVWTGDGPATGRDIKTSGADIACLQEVSPAEAKEARDAVGADWDLVHTGNPNTAYAIISRFPAIKRFGETSAIKGGIGALYQLPTGLRVAVFCHHGFHEPYGPYQLGVDKMPVDKVIQSEKNIRGGAMEELMSFMTKSLGGIDSVILAGDFNAPSHVDYNPPVAWPISTMIHAVGFKDSFDEKYPHRAKKSACAFDQNDVGITWAKLKDKEPHSCFDRIDFIYYSSPVMKNVESKTIELSVSDHRSVLTTFEISDFEQGSKASKPSPGDSMSGLYRRPYISWAKPEKAARFKLYLGKDQSLNVNPVELKSNSYQAPLLDSAATYYWRVDVTDTSGKVTTGDVWSFKTFAGLGLKTDKTSFGPGEKITVSFDGAQAADDWIGVFVDGAPKAMSWKYPNDSTDVPKGLQANGKVTIDAPSQSGTYFIRGLLKDGYRDVDQIEIKVP